MKRKDLNEIETAVFVIDMNNGFCEKGFLADPKIKRIVPAITKIISYFLRIGEGLFIVNDGHTKNSVELKRFPEHDMIGTEEVRTIKELRIYEKYATRCFTKNSTSAMFAPGVMETLIAMKKLKRIVLVGCCTDICIQNFAVDLRNFFDQNNLDIEIIVPLNAVDTFDNEYHKREEYNELGKRVMENSGVTVVPRLVLEKKEGN